MTGGGRSSQSIPLSLTQQYFLDMLVDEGFEPTWQHLVASFEFPAELDPAHLPTVIQRVGECHPILSYRDGEPFLDPSNDNATPCRVFDLRGRSEAELDLVLSHFADSPFDLMHGPMWRVAFARATGKTIVTIVAHHLVSDATSGWLIARDCILRLFGEEAGATAAPFEEFVLNEREQFSGAELVTRLEYWAEQIDGAALELALDHRPARNQLSSAEVVPLACAPNAGELLLANAKARRLTPLPLLTATVSAAVTHATGAEDVLCGVITDVRGQKFATTVGPFADLMLVRDRPIAGEDDTQRLARIRDSFFNGWTQHVPMSLLRRKLPQLAARADSSPCDVFLNFLPTPPPQDWSRIRALCGDATPSLHFRCIFSSSALPRNSTGASSPIVDRSSAS
jgi:hypothetical protein